MKADRKVTWLIIVIVILLLNYSNGFSQEPLVIDRVSPGIDFDGIPDENTWKSISELPLTMHSPVYGNKPTESSIVKIAYDDQYLYLSGVFNYADIEDMRAIGRKRDYMSMSTDWFGMILSTFNDGENAFEFWTNPHGLRFDGAVKNDAHDLMLSNNFDISWNTFWEVKTNISQNGWTAEFRIPLSSLRFQVEDHSTIMGLVVVRYMAAKSEMDTYPAISDDYPFAYHKASLSQPIQFQDLKPKKPVYLTPYLTAGLTQENVLKEGESTYTMESSPKYDAGLDIKYSITNNLTTDITINTDFAQVEADDQKINLTRYSLFFPEKRAFFLEKTDVFDFPLLGGNNLFYSRRIGIYDGNPVRIYGGARITGRINNWDVGFLDMQTAKHDENPGENFGVLRLKRTFPHNTYVGGMVTSRLGTNGNYNFVYGLDGQLRAFGDDYLILKFSQTYENDIESRLVDSSPSRILFQWQKRRQKGFSYDFVYTYSGPTFNPGIGFEVKDDYQGFRSIFNYGWFPEDKNPVRIHTISLGVWNLWNTKTGLTETFMSTLTWDFEAKKGYRGSLTANVLREDLYDTLKLGNEQALVLPGRYSFGFLTAKYNTSASHAISSASQIDFGTFYDGWKFSFTTGPQIKIGAGLDISITYNFDHVNFPERNTKFTNHIAGFKGLLTVTTKTSLSAFVQYNTAIKKVIANVRFRYNPREGNDFYIVYNEGLNTSLNREVPRLPYTEGRTILLKYTYTFRI